MTSVDSPLAVASGTFRIGGDLEVVRLGYGASPVMLPIPGTSSVAHLEDNVHGATVPLTSEQAARMEQLA